MSSPSAAVSLKPRSIILMRMVRVFPPSSFLTHFHLPTHLTSRMFQAPFLGRRVKHS